MKHLTKIFIFSLLLLLLLRSNIAAEQQVLRITMSQENAYNRLSKLIATKLPRNIEILIYDLVLLNGPEETQKAINSNFFKILSAKQYIYRFKIHFISEVLKESTTITKENLETNDELEMIALGKVLNLDAVLLGSVIIQDGQTKKVWDNGEHKFVDKRIALLQGNIFSTENSESLLGFSYTFILD